MHTKVLPVVIFLGGLAAGCSSSSPPPAVFERGPHQGFLRQLPDGSGFAEIVTEQIRKTSPKSSSTQLSVYFLAPDRTSSLNPLPTDVTMDVIWPDSTPRQTLILSSKPAADDPAGAAKYVSIPGDYDGALSGTMTLKLGEKTMSAAF